MKTLVAYFSASGNTASLAKRVAQAANADLFEIKPVEPYTDADLRWTNPLARCNKEKIGKKNVPIADRVQNLDEYEKDAGFMLVYADINDAIKTNGEYTSECFFNEVMIGRDKRVLEMIRDEILKKGSN